MAITNKPAWIDLSTKDPEWSREFYAKLFGWQVEVNPDPQYGGYAIAKIDGNDVAGIGPTQAPDAPTAWNLYIGTEDVDDLAKRVEAAGGTVVAAPFDVGDQGRMAVFQDPTGAFISAWQPSGWAASRPSGPSAFGWAELNARGIEQGVCRSTSTSSAGRPRRARWARASRRTPSCSTTARASPAPWR